MSILPMNHWHDASATHGGVKLDAYKNTTGRKGMELNPFAPPDFTAQRLVAELNGGSLSHHPNAISVPEEDLDDFPAIHPVRTGGAIGN